MGQYNQAVITSAGQGLLAGVIASGKSLAFTNAKTSTRIYSSGLEALTSIADVMQTDAVSSATVMSNSQVKISTRFTNEDITAAYDINTIGIFAKADGDASDTLFAVITAVTPDSMPKYTSSNPVAYIYDVTIGMSNAQNITLVVSPTGTPSYGDLAAAQTAAENASAANLAPAYDSTATYAKDDFCVNGGKLYQCNADISTAEAFNPDHWTEVKVTEVMGGGGGVTPEIEAEIQNAQWKTETSTQLFNETVTTVAGVHGNEATLSYSELITADTLKVTFNGVEYTCPQIMGSGGIAGYGGFTETGPDFTVFPFLIITGVAGGNMVYTETAGTYSVSAGAENTTYTDAFKKGVAENSTFYVDFENGDNGLVCNKTIPEIATAYEGGANVLGRYDGMIYLYNAEYVFSHTDIDRGNNEVVIREIVLFDNPNNVTIIEQFEARVSATISGYHPVR